MLTVIGGQFTIDDFEIPPGWFHVTWVFYGPDEGQGFRVYYEGGELLKNTLTDQPLAKWNSSGRVVVGRRVTDVDDHYGNVEVDELIFWKGRLTKEDAELLRNNS